jgi:colicin import membrane protein
MTATLSFDGLDNLRPPGNEQGKHLSWVLALAMHVGLAMVLIYGIQWQTKRPETVSVDLVRSLPSLDSVSPAPTEPIKQPEVEPTPEPPAKAVVEPPPKALAKTLPPPPSPVKPDIATKEKPKPPVAKPEPAPLPNAFAKALAEETRRLDSSNAAKLAAQELDVLRQAQATSAKKKQTDAWIAQIQAKVRGNIVLPPQVRGNPEAVFELTQLPSGEIINVRLQQSSGIATLDAAIERAIRKSSPLPKPERAEVFERALELRVRPLDKEPI